VLHTLIPIEQQLPTDDGRWFRVRIMPYRTLENRIDGVAVTFVNITSFKLLEAELRQKHDELAALQAKAKTG
jgi:two-component system CheB/CheR fusion protein